MTVIEERSIDPELDGSAMVGHHLAGQLVGLLGEPSLYEGGLSVRTTLNPRLQAFADDALRDGLIAYDRRHGWRGPLRELSAEGVDLLVATLGNHDHWSGAEPISEALRQRGLG